MADALLPQSVAVRLRLLCIIWVYAWLLQLKKTKGQHRQRVGPWSISSFQLWNSEQTGSTFGLRKLSRLG
jgi:hypothetical protein